MLLQNTRFVTSKNDYDYVFRLCNLGLSFSLRQLEFIQHASKFDTVCQISRRLTNTTTRAILLYASYASAETGFRVTWEGGVFLVSIPVLLFKSGIGPSSLRLDSDSKGSLSLSEKN